MKILFIIYVEIVAKAKCSLLLIIYNILLFYFWSFTGYFLVEVSLINISSAMTLLCFCILPYISILQMILCLFYTYFLFVLLYLNGSFNFTFVSLNFATFTLQFTTRKCWFSLFYWWRVCLCFVHFFLRFSYFHFSMSSN